MKLQTLSSILLLMLTPLLQCQDSANESPRVEVAALTHQQITRRIFKNEREMIDGIRNTSPWLETYLQSLWPNIKSQSPIDDGYFLSTVNFKRGYEVSGGGRQGYQTFLFGQSHASRKIRLNNGDKVAVYPDGYLDMLFVDLEDFDADTYNLRYVQNDTWDGRSCLIFSVMPKTTRDHGRFEGQIWVEPTNLKIVRIKGTFTPIRIPWFSLGRFLGYASLPLYFHFDSTRQEVAPGIWLPSYSYFDESRTWRQIDRNALTDIHYRGHIFIWGYQNSDAVTGTAWNDRPVSVARLEKQKLLAAPGIVEQQLDDIARQILTANKIDMHDIKCRVLLTTPVELFSLGHTIIVSRGLLNILPNDSVIPVLLSHEIAKILLTQSATPNSGSAWIDGLTMSKKAGYSNGMDPTSGLLTEIVQHSRQVPNLLRARFGSGLLDIATRLPAPPRSPGKKPIQSLILRGKYTIDSWGTSLQVRQESAGSVMAQSATSF